MSVNLNESDKSDDIYINKTKKANTQSNDYTCVSTNNSMNRSFKHILNKSDYYY